MSDQTPALARATEALNHAFDEEPRTALADLDEPARLLLADAARAAVSAALHDPDDPDWLARVLDAHVDTGDGPTGAECSCGVVMEHTVDGASMDIYVSRHVADAVRAALLGGDA